MFTSSLKSLWQYPERVLAYIKNRPGTVLPLIFCLYFGLCTIFYDVINKNHTDFITLPYQFLFSQKNEATLTELTGKNIGNKTGKSQTGMQNNLYVFVLDVGNSMSQVTLNNHLFTKYVEGIAAVNEQFGYDAIHANNTPTPLDLAKVRLYELLLELTKMKRNNTTDKFAVWALRNNENLIYPPFKEAKIQLDTIKNAILKIDGLKQDPDIKANYLGLFQWLTDAYKEELSQQPLHQKEGPFFILTILSDLLPDEKKQYKARSQRLEQDWEELEDKIDQISHPNTIVNMVVFSEDESDNQKTILPALERNIDPFKLNKFFMGDKPNPNILYFPRKSETSINFYYSTSLDISSTSFMIRSIDPEPDQIKIDLPEAISYIIPPKISIYCEKLGDIGDGIGESKQIRTGGGSFKTIFCQDQTIRFSLEKAPFSPHSHPAPVLRMTLDNKNETLYIPITFIKIFPHWVSILFVLLHFFLLLTFILQLLPFPPRVKETVTERFEKDYYPPGQDQKKGPVKEKIVPPKTRPDSILVFILPLVLLTGLIYLFSQQICTSPKPTGKDTVAPMASVEEVKEKLNTVYTNRNFELSRYTRDELVKDHKGIYYLIDIKDVDTQETIRFRVGEYTIEDYNTKFRKSINIFADKVLKKLKDKVPYKIFIKGQADDELAVGAFRREFDPGFKPGKIKYYKRLKGGGKTKFIPAFAAAEVKEPILNEDLPNLRAAFIREKFYEMYKEERGLATILDGDVVLKISEKYRNAMLILWVKWPESKNKK